jgi:hypothetical protein
MSAYTLAANCAHQQPHTSLGARAHAKKTKKNDAHATLCGNPELGTDESHPCLLVRLQRDRLDPVRPTDDHANPIICKPRNCVCSSHKPCWICGQNRHLVWLVLAHAHFWQFTACDGCRLHELDVLLQQLGRLTWEAARVDNDNDNVNEQMISNINNDKQLTAARLGSVTQKKKENRKKEEGTTPSCWTHHTTKSLSA